jgi:hypothetical protein
MSQVRNAHRQIDGAFLIRRNSVEDMPALQRLAVLDSRTLPGGRFLLAEVRGELIAAAPLDAEGAPLCDPFWPTAHIRDFLDLQVRGLRARRERDLGRLAPYALRLRDGARLSGPGDFAGATSPGRP